MRRASAVKTTADYNDMIYAATSEEIQVRRKAFTRKWRLKHRAVADSLEEACDRSLRPAAAEPTAQRAHNQHDRAAARGVQTKDQDPDCAALGRHGPPCYSGHSLPPATSTCQGRRMADALNKKPSLSRLTSQPETIPSCYRRSRHTKFNHSRAARWRRSQGVSCRNSMWERPTVRLIGSSSVTRSA
jgi:hypothetical protein